MLLRVEGRASRHEAFPRRCRERNRRVSTLPSGSPGRVRKALELRSQDGPSVGCQLGESTLSPHWARLPDGGLRERRGPPDGGRSGAHHR